MSVANDPAATPPAKKLVKRAVGPKLRKLLHLIFVLVAILGANSCYMAGVTFVEWAKGQTYQDQFYLYNVLLHVALGLLLVVPFVVFGVIHMLNTRGRKNRRAIRVGYALTAVSVVVLVSGVLLLRIDNFSLRSGLPRNTAYWCHVIAPLLALWLYWLHRLVGPRIKWRVGLAYAGVVGAVVSAMVWLRAQDPRQWNVAGPVEGVKYFEPALARTATGNFIPAKTLMMDDYCQKCHPDVHAGWSQSVHRFSSFNNAAYLAAVRETRDVMFKRDGNVQGSRFCAACHDPVPFFSGAFDDPKFDDVKHPTAHAGITCTVCHAITHIERPPLGNGSFTIEEPVHYPFAFSDNPLLQWVNQQLVKAKPSFHKKTFLKDFHTTSEFCAECHKVDLPYELTHYKEFLRGQNHYDSYYLSGVSGHGARSFYYPPKAQQNCNGCHMPLAHSDDFAAKYFDEAKQPSIHNHLFPAANTGVAWLRDQPDVIAAHEKFHEGVMRVDIFGVKENGEIDGKLHAPLRPSVPILKPGSEYLLETVMRTVKMGHHFTQGTADSNEIWLDVTVTSGDRVIGRSGAIDDETEVDPWSYFVNVFMLDKEGNRISRRNAQDIFTPLYNHQIPPGAARVAHYRMAIPPDVNAPVTVEVKLQYRKFDKQYMDFVTSKVREGDLPIRGHVPGEKYRNELPVTTLAVDKVTFPVEGASISAENSNRDIPEWQRWNDYGIALLLEGKAELRQAADAFAEVEKLNRYDGPLNLARVLNVEGRIDEAVAAVGRAAKYTDPPAPPWTLAWLSGLLNRQQGRLEEAEKDFRSVLENNTAEMRERGFDFSVDIEVINLLGQTLFDQARRIRAPDQKAQRDALLQSAVEQFQKTLKVDSEDVTAHYNLQLLYAQLGDQAKSEEHRKQHARVKPDDNARDRAIALARKKYPAGNAAAEALAIYSLNRSGAPGLAQKAMNESKVSLGQN
jgi:tetratricopeptide (TPR) repeat protein